MTIPFWCVFAHFMLVWIGRLPVTIAMAKQPTGLDNHYPRQQQSSLTGFGARAHAANLNLLESIAPFGIAVLIANVAHANPARSAQLAVAFIVLRVVYLALYLADQATARSVVWIASYLCILGQLVLAAMG
jgi:uncharacterized MAPEG superfamily protein